jgi:TonB-dependent starch-binding outer membrane protein SusC
MKPTICLLAFLCPFLCLSQTISGYILNEELEAVASASVTLKNTNRSTLSDKKGYFKFEHPTTSGPPIVLVTAIGYESAERRMHPDSVMVIRLKRKITELDEAIVMAYGTTTRRFNTGNIDKLGFADIEKQPVSNPLAALSGRIPGLLVTQNSGVPGSTINIQIRGRTSLDLELSQNDPLFIIDGVPFESGNVPINQINSAANTPINSNTSPPSGLSPFNLINPQDIESIEVLKDADATAIYGSRGANGVIMITTRKAKAGRTKFSLRMHTGLSRVTRTIPLLNTVQYLEMRKEAFANDGITPTASNAPDLITWDTTQYHDYIKEFIGGTAQATDLQATISGGNLQTQFQIGAGYHRETNVFPGKHADTRGSFHMNLTHIPQNRKWDIRLSVIYGSDRNRLFRTDLTRYIDIPPHLQLYTSTGQLAWQQGGINFSAMGFINPLAELEKKFSMLNQSLASNLQFTYRILKALQFRTSFGYNSFISEEESITPKSSIAPENSALANALFANASRTNWIVEPQLEYNGQIAKGKLTVLAGSTFQQRHARKSYIQGSGYTNDLLLSTLDGAATISANNSYELYRYNAFFGRINYNWDQKYLVNLSARRDGSSRFGPGRQFANFGAIGIGWIFSNETWLETQSILSFGKVRTSYGITGNDQIGDYRYLDLWSVTTNPYQGTPGLRPALLFNPDFHWEKNRKWEAAIELGFFKDRLSLSTAFYLHRCSNQLVSYRLPNQTGFASVVKNLPAVVENKGWEIIVQSTNIRNKTIHWKTAMNITIPSNKLVSFPGLASSSYRSIYVEGESLNVIAKYHFLGVDPSTGLYNYEDVNGDGVLSSLDTRVSGFQGQKWYGGLSNSVSWQQFDLDVFFEYRKQVGLNYFGQIGSKTVGFAYNQPTLVLDRWRKPGDQSTVQRFVAVSSSPGFQTSNRLSASDAIYSDASFLRLKTMALSYRFSELVLDKLELESVKMFIQAQNLLTVTNYTGADPETQNLFQLPPLRTIVVGMQLTF